MNINEFMPKSINMEKVLRELPDYDGSFTEFVDMLMNHEVTLITDDAGQILDFNIKADEDSILDTITGMKFASAYSRYSRDDIMNWLKIVVTAKQSGKAVTEIDEDAGTCLVGGEEVQFLDVEKYAEDDMDYDDEDADDDSDNESEEEELPSDVSIDLWELQEMFGDEIGDAEDYDDADELLPYIKKFLRKTYKHCLARGVDLEVTYYTDGHMDVDYIEWGRKLTDSELANLDY